MVAYHYDSNAILIQPLKRRQAESIADVWIVINNWFADAGAHLNTYILDSKCSNDLKTAFGKKKVTFQRVPPACYRENSTERALKTSKAHFKAGLTTVDPNCPIREWD